MSASTDIRAVAAAITQQVAATTTADQGVTATKAALTASATTLNQTATALRSKTGKRGTDVSPAIPDTLDAVASALKAEITRLASTGLPGIASALTVQVDALGRIASALEPVVEPPPPQNDVILYRDTFKDGKHSPALPAAPGFVYEAMAGTFIFTKDDKGRDVFRLLIPADGNDNRNEQRFHGFGRRTELFVGFKRRMSPNFTHEKIGTSATNWKQLRLFTENYQEGAHLGFSILAGPTPGGFGQILFEAPYPANFNPMANKGTWDRVALAGIDERWGFYVKLASGPGAKDGVMKFWYQGVDLMKKQMDAAIAAGKVPFDWNHIDLWDYTDGKNYLSNGFYPGWDNSGSTNEEYLDYHEFVLATEPLQEYTTP